MAIITCDEAETLINEAASLGCRSPWEVELFEALKSLYPDLTPLSATDRADGITSDSYIELKCRRTHYETLIIEKVLRRYYIAPSYPTFRTR